MKLIESIMTKNPCYTAGKKITVKGLMLHSVGCPQPKASVFINNWNKESYGNACVHGFIDGNDGIVYQTLPWNHRAWHCASGKNGSGNNTHIGIEMCEPACIKYTGGSSFTCSDIATAQATVKRTYEAAVELFAMLCKEYNLNPTADGVIISHKEGHARGIASNHGDPEHLWNGLGMGYTMDGFRKAVKAAMADNKDTGSSASDVTYRVQVGAYSVKANADKQAAKLKAAGFETYMVKSGGMYKVQVGAYSKKENAEAMVKKLKAAGSDAFITTKKGEAVTASETKKTVQEIAKEVIAGKWGNGENRKKRLKAAGYDYDAVQEKVNAMLK